MTRRFQHRFVELIPVQLDERVLYVSMPNEVAVHLCASGCGKEVVTPLGQSGWTLFFDGAVTLRPSIGNWGYECRAHYWIIGDQIIWAEASRKAPARPGGPRTLVRLGLFDRALRRLLRWFSRMRN